ncbi:hypothetical protein [Nioella aestuarii]|uniref:hypothetical protein n=1 Tax=Nioella aestuarii TaxID=1662864 RepID=UPI003D7F706C
MSKRYTYLEHQRSGLAWMGLVSGLMMLAVAADRTAPIWVWALLTPCILICVLQIALRPSYGIDYSARSLSIFNGFSRRSLPLSRVDHLRLGADHATIVLLSGDEIMLPQQVLHNTIALIRETTDRGIPVRAL